MTHSPLLPIALAFASGIAFAPYFHLTAYEQFAALLVCTGLSALLTYFKKCWPALILGWLGFGLSGTMLAAFERVPPPAAHIESLAQHGKFDVGDPIKVSGWVRSPSQARPGSYVFELTAEKIEQAGAALDTTGTIRVYYYPKSQNEMPLRLAYGTRVTLSLQSMRAPRNYGNPGMYDFAGAMRRREISFTGVLRNRNTDLHVLAGQSGSRWQGTVLHVRAAMLASIERMLPDKPAEQSILKAMLLGDDNWLGDSTEEAFQRSGTYHVLVISGWNVAVFAGPLLLILGRFRIANWLSSLIVLLSVAGFALIAQSEIPIVRASSMFMVYLAARFIFRRRALMNSLAAAALLLLILHPSDLFDGGFQLSFLAVMTLAGISLPALEWKLSPFRIALRDLFQPRGDSRFPPQQGQFRCDLRTLFSALAPVFSASEPRQLKLADGMRSATWLLLGLAEALFFTVIMQVGYALVTAQYFHRLTWSGIIGNLLILPIASCIVLLGMILVPLELMIPFIGKLLGPVLGWLCLALEGIARISADMDFLNFRVATPPLWLAAGFILTAIALAMLISRRSKWSGLAGAGLALWCVTLSLGATRQDCPKGQLEVTALDVGQGDSLLVCFPQGSTMLVDAGGAIPIPGSPVRRQDIGETVVSAYLWHRGITQLDYVVLSHDHFDHLGGLEAVFENFPVQEFWMGPDAADRNMAWLRRRAANAGARIVWPVRNSADTIPLEIDGVRVEVLSPPADWSPRRVGNDDSIVLRLTYGQRSILLAGDIESRMERALASSDATLKSDVLKVAHHGSRTSSTPEFLQRVDPGISVVSVGAYGRFGHPNAGVLERLSEHSGLLYTTPRAGAISVRTDGYRIDVNTFNDSLRDWPRFLP